MAWKTSANKPTRGTPFTPGQSRIIKIKSYAKAGSGNSGTRKRRNKTKSLTPYVPPVKVPKWARKYANDA